MNTALLYKMAQAWVNAERDHVRAGFAAASCQTKTDRENERDARIAAEDAQAAFESELDRMYNQMGRPT